MKKKTTTRKKTAAPKTQKANVKPSLKDNAAGKTSSKLKNFVQTLIPANSEPKKSVKAEYLKRHGIKIRKVTVADKSAAKTPYQQKARCVIRYGDKEYFSQNGSLKDCRAVVAMNKKGGNGNGKKK